MARNDDRNQGDRDQNKKPRNPQSRAGDARLNDTFIQRYIFRLLTDLFGDMTGSFLRTPQGKAFLKVLIAKFGPKLLELLTTAGSAATQSPEIVRGILHLLGLGDGAFFYVAEAIDEGFDGLRSVIRTQVEGEGETKEKVLYVNQHDADRELDKVIQKHKADAPTPPKSYADIFMALLLSEQAAWDQILSVFTPEQRTAFALYRNQFTSVDMMRAALNVALDQSETVVDPQARLERRAKVLLEFLERHFETKKPAVTKVAAFAGELAKGTKDALAKTFRVLPLEERNASHAARMAALQALSDEMDQD